ncbi:unnamed protein product [Rotaria socialis]|uniref:Peptidase M14 domain-containing protein n=2 Tax=Rotaria socialis TaxID=392032 RepID=A0A820SEK1_9BILA|nr:unnamed protein product [Rotaria socialis]CAF3596465.1 unnamed protein product [Rotaria socialis]CAF4238972.1 unnamed protein product [Rotaria socialis]CAF4396784.1 unnamed protein product [Rotaria socialis]CAF4452765.1 unnamed protein product [Rotaria socialis]
MTTMICFSIIILTLVSSLIAQYPYFHNPSWNYTSQQSFMGPVELYVGVNVPKTNHPTAPPIDAGLPIDNNNHHQYRNKLFTTRTTYFFHPMSTSTIQTKRYYHYRRRNRTQTTSSPTSNSLNHQRFGVIINVYEPTDTTTAISLTTTQIPWWKLTTTTTTTTTTTQIPWWKLTTTTLATAQAFYERFPKLPSYIHRPPPPTVPRSFTTPTTYIYPSPTTRRAATTTMATTTTTTASTSTFSRSTSTSSMPRPSIPSPSSWLFTVPSFSQIIDQYPRYPTILRWFEELSRHPNISRFFAYDTVGHTHENRSLVVAKIGLMPFRKNRRSVWIDGGIHAREWISTATVLYTIARIINGTLARDADVRKLIDKYDFYFMPVVNPDGYVYTHDDVKTDWNTDEEQDQQRMWRKNRRPHSDCPGVDLNRNFPFAWDNRGASKFPCEETYRGPYPESEPEVRAITSFILKRRRYFHAFITLHAFGNLWMLPFSFSTRIRPHDYHRTERLLLEMNSLSMNTFKIGQSSTVLYAATGTSEDWAKAIAQIPHTFSIELPPSTDAFDMRQDELNGFTFYADKDIGTVAESTYRLLELYLKNLTKLQSPSRITI